MEGNKPKGGHLKEHAFLSAIYTFYCLKNLIEDRHLLVFSYVACKRHHTNLHSFYEEASIGLESELKFLITQAKSIDEKRTNIFISNLNLPEEMKETIHFNKTTFLDSLPNIVKEIKSFRKDIRKCKANIKEFITFQYLFSLILDADKTEAGAKPFKPERVEKILPDVVVSFKEKHLKSKSPINELREEAFNEVLDRELDTSHKLYSITLPTGMGKTLTGFAFALKLREAIIKEKGTVPRIIYSLPFLSIIDQNADVLENVLKEAFSEVSSSILLKHHHLSGVGRFIDEREEFDYGVSRVLTEGWNSEIVITTFVQLFETLISWRNSTSRRFNKIANSIVILDEVQSLPTKYWYLLRKFIKEISGDLNTYFIFMTATQPYLVDGCMELVSKEKYLEKLDRIIAYFDLEEKTIDEFLRNIEIRSDKTYLFITNTIFSSKELYKKLKDIVKDRVCYLSTSITPYERRKRIEEIRKGFYRIVVSTQLVEAGVDIDFDVVYRDFAPLDSLNQSAGRCNRNMERGKGEFRVIRLVDEKGQPFTKGVYDSVLLYTTRELLKSVGSLSEKDFTLLIEEYFKTLWDRISRDRSEDILEAVKCFRFTAEENNTAISGFQLIEDLPYRKDVFIQLNDEAIEVWEKAKNTVRDLKGRKIGIFEAKESFEKLKPDFYKFVVSVDIRNNQPLWDEDLNIFVVDKNNINDYYNTETGFIERGGSFIGL